jgi:isoleucyl-tRNA synthetase
LVDNDDASRPHLTDLEQQNIGASGFASLLLWTTTPWTLPANVAAAVHPELDYELVKQAEELFYVSKGARATLVRGEHEVVGRGQG